MNNCCEKAHYFHRLHASESPLLLGNVWDPLSARILENSGFKAIATSSAAIAFSLGFPDGQHLSFDKLLDVVTKIADSINIPFSVDMEAGYGGSPSDIAERVGRLIEHRIVGINLEDGTGDPQHPLFESGEVCQRIKAIAKMAERRQWPLFINVRTDAVWVAPKSPLRIDEAVQRANVYLQAGAHGVFVPGHLNNVAIRRLVQEIDGPLNLITNDASLDMSQYRELGVSRVSLGPRPLQMLIGQLEKMALDLVQKGEFDSLYRGQVSYQDLNDLWRKP